MTQYQQLFKQEREINEFEYKTTQNKTSGNSFPAVGFVLLNTDSQNQMLKRGITRFF